MEILLGSNLSTSRRLAVVLVVVLRPRLGIETACHDGRRMNGESRQWEFQWYHPKNGRGRLGHDAKQIQKCRHARRVEVDQLAYYTGVEVRVPYIPINLLSDVGTHGRFQVM
jgi:hypothetical protein